MASSSTSDNPSAASTSPRLPSPPPFTEVQIAPTSTANSKIHTATPSSLASPRRIRPGTKSRNIASGPPLVPLGELDSAFQLQEHLAALLSDITCPPGSENTIPLSREACERLATPPEGVEESLWCYELTRRLTRDLNILLVALLNDNCTASSCPEMRASEWQYLCAVHDPPQACCAIDYSTHTLDQAATMLCTTRFFPSRLSLAAGSIKHLGSIFRRLYRIFAHSWFQHRNVFWEVENEYGLYLFFKTVSDHYHLIPKDNLTLPPEAEGLKAPEEEEFEEELIDEFDRGTGGQDRSQELSEENEEDDDDDDYPDSDESESDEEDEGEAVHGEDDEDDEDEFELDMDAHILEEDGDVGKGGVIENHLEDLEELELEDDEHMEKILLLLPASPENPTLVCLQSLYAPSLTAAFQQAPSTHASTLDIAIHVPHLSSTAAVSRRKTFNKTQRLLTRLYSAAYSAAVEEKKEDLVDVRIVFLSDTGQTPEQEAMAHKTSFGPVVSLLQLADSGREWRSIVIASPPPKEGEEDGEGEGEVIAKNFLAYWGDKVGQDTVVLRTDLGDIPENTSNEEVDGVTEDGEEHSLVTVGGTFDHLHPGHKLLLTMTAFLLSPLATSPRLIICITGEHLLVNKQHAKFLTSWTSRTAEILRFLRNILDFSFAPTLQTTTESSTTPATETMPRALTTILSCGLAVETVEINDPFGPTITNKAISALVVSTETAKGGEAVNMKRVEMGWKKLEVYMIDVIEGGEGEKMSSTGIRKRLEEREAPSGETEVPLGEKESLQHEKEDRLA